MLDAAPSPPVQDACEQTGGVCDDAGIPPAALALVTEKCLRELGRPLVSVHVTMRRLRPYSEILRIDLDLGEQRLPLILKRIVHDPRNRHFELRGHGAAREAEGMRRASERLAHDSCLSVPRLYAFDGQHDWLLMESVEGQELDERLAAVRYGKSSSSRQRVLHDFYQLGCWLRQFQGEARWEQDGNEWLDPWLQTTLHRLAEIGSSDFWSRTVRPAETLDRVGAQLTKLRLQLQGTRVPVVPSHGDFGPWNVLAGPDRLTVIDLFAFREDLSLMDSLNVITYLEMLESSVTLSRRGLRRLAHAFLEGYGPLPLSESMALYRFCLACQRVCRLHDEVMRGYSSWLSRWCQRRAVDRLVARLLSV